jgi:hypothetical protein
VIAAFLGLAQIVAGPVSPEPYPQLAPSAVLRRYAEAMHALKEPSVISFDYTLEQTGPRTLSQTHRVFRSGNIERDETLTSNGQRLTRPIVRIFRGRRNRYTVRLLAPRAADYDFAFVGPLHDGRHLDYVFRVTPKHVMQFKVTNVTIDGLRFLPVSIDFATALSDGSGSIAFGSNARWWVPYVATARAMVADDLATEKLTFYTYRFPPSLPPSTFTQAHRVVLPHVLPDVPAEAEPTPTPTPVPESEPGAPPAL